MAYGKPDIVTPSQTRKDFDAWVEKDKAKEKSMPRKKFETYGDTFYKTTNPVADSAGFMVKYYKDRFGRAKDKAVEFAGDVKAGASSIAKSLLPGDKSAPAPTGDLSEATKQKLKENKVRTTGRIGLADDN